MEHMAALQLNRRRTRQRLDETNHAHIVRILRQLRYRSSLCRLRRRSHLTLVAAHLQTRHALRFAAHTSARMSARLPLGARIQRVLLALRIGAHIPNGQQPSVAGHTAEPTPTDHRRQVSGRSGRRRRCRPLAHCRQRHLAGIVWMRTAIGTRSSTTTTNPTNQQRILPVAELDHRLQRSRIGQRQQPEQLRAATTLVQLDADRFLLLLANRTRMLSLPPAQMQEPVAIGTQSAALFALDDRRRLAVVVIGAQRTRRSVAWVVMIVRLSL